MLSRLTVGTLALLAAVAKADSWGSAWSLGPTHGSAAIIQATTHFQPGLPPNPHYNYLFLWPGTSNGTSGLIQSGCDSAADMKAYCGASDTQWCCGASYFGCINGVCSQFSGKYTPVEATDVLTIDYKLQSDQKTWIQTVTLKGTVISTQTSYDGPLLQGGFGTGTECQQNCQGSVDWQYYTDTTIYLSAVDNAFPNTLGKGAGVVATPLYSNDGGKTWQVDSIAIPPMTIDANGNPVTHTNTLTHTSTTTTKATTTAKTTTTSKTTSTTSKTTTTTGSSSTGTVPKYGQCGGIGYTGPTQCASGSTCTYSNDWYSQCV